MLLDPKAQVLQLGIPFQFFEFPVKVLRHAHNTPTSPAPGNSYSKLRVVLFGN